MPVARHRRIPAQQKIANRGKKKNSAFINIA